MLEGKAVLRETDMLEVMQSHVMDLAYQALDAHEVSDCQSIAHFIKQMMEFLIFKDGKDFRESREEAVRVLQKATNSDS